MPLLLRQSVSADNDRDCKEDVVTVAYKQEVADVLSQIPQEVLKR
jgi:hypothetical protein